jgi:hypothetical protein
VLTFVELLLAEVSRRIEKAAQRVADERSVARLMLRVPGADPTKNTTIRITFQA